MPQRRARQTGNPRHILCGSLWNAADGHVSGNQRWRLPLGAYGQFLAPACAAPGQNGASVLGLHTGAKPMRLAAVTNTANMELLGDAGILSKQLRFGYTDVQADAWARGSVGRYGRHLH